MPCNVPPLLSFVVGPSFIFCFYQLLLFLLKRSNKMGRINHCCAIKCVNNALSQRRQGCIWGAAPLKPTSPVCKHLEVTNLKTWVCDLPYLLILLMFLLLILFFFFKGMGQGGRKS